MEGEDVSNTKDIDSDHQKTEVEPSFKETAGLLSSSNESDVPAADKSVKPTNQRSSNRLTKRTRKDQSSEVVLKKTAVKQEGSKTGCKTRRPWELWSVEDKNVFFEALCEYGKDFENIQSYIAQRSKKKGVAINMIKNKEQVRHFYYRTWHKISKFLEISESVQKQTQELYGLINYGELRKKVGGCLNEKNRIKLNELVYSGVTTVKYKGKKLRIKTPVCRALKKLNNFADAKEPESEKLPKEICVEFRPSTNAAWLQVQDLAQNPRVRTKVCLQKRLKIAIEYLQKRWSPYRLKRKEQILHSLPNNLSEESACDTPPILRVKPARDAKIYPLTFSIIDTASSSDVCLEKYMKLSNSSLCKELKSKKIIHLKPKLPSDKTTETSQGVLQKTNSLTDTVNEQLPKPSNLSEQLSKTNKVSDESSEQCDLSADAQDFSSKPNISSEDNSYINVLTPPKSVPESDQPVEQNFSEIQRSLSSINSLNDQHVRLPTLQTESLDVFSGDVDYNPLLNSQNFTSSEFLNVTEQTNINSDDMDDLTHTDLGSENLFILTSCAMSNTKNDAISTEKTKEKNASEKEKTSNEKSEKTEDSSYESGDDIYCNSVRQGWTVQDAEYLTFGELYLMLGKPSTIVLEYEFEYPESTLTTIEETTVTAKPESSDLTHIINKVFEVAQSYFIDPKQKQLPGKQHSRGSSSKSSKPKSSGLNDKASKDTSSCPQISNSETVLNCKVVNNKNVDVAHSVNSNVNFSSSSSSSLTTTTTSSTATTSTKTTVATKTSSSDKHIFIMPVGTAPRPIKQQSQSSLKEELGKLLPSTRRGCRVRRKPVVVPRPLLPREGMRPMTGPRPMTVVHLVPSVSPMTTVIPPCSRPKSSIPAPKKVVNILPAGMPLDIHPIQVPVINQLNPDTSQTVILQNSVSSPHVIVNSSSAEKLQIINNPMTGVSSASESALNTQPVSSLDLPSLPQFELNTTSNDLNTLNLTLLSGHTVQGQNEQKDSFASLSPLSLTDSSNLTSNTSPTFLDEFGLSSKNSVYDSSNLPCLNLDSGPSKNLPSSENSSQHPVTTSSTEFQWLNGESTELSLNTFLNSIESPPKMSSAASNIATENSNLAPVVDSQVRCLLDECSIDFITKFEDLAEVINSSSSNDSKQT